jgi:hypothetical protein
LGFSPPGNPDGQPFADHADPRERKNRVESRTGYFTSGAASDRETAQQRIDRITMPGDAIKDFPVTLELQKDRTVGAEASLHVTIAVDASGLRFPEKEGRRGGADLSYSARRQVKAILLPASSP